MANNSTWSAARTALLRKLKAQGLSAAQIARAINADKSGGPVTRNAVVGKCERLGLTTEAPLRPNGRLSSNRIKAGALRARHAQPGPPPPGAVRFLDRAYGRQCAMFLNGEEGAMGFVCGAACAPERQFCAECMARAYDVAPMPRLGRAA
ncbi:MAG: GcrA family cell cycle regulator [Burkholderiaceae bacterium]